MSTTRTPAKRAQLPCPRCPRLTPADAANQPTQKMTQPTPITMSTTRIEVPLRSLPGPQREGEVGARAPAEVGHWRGGSQEGNAQGQVTGLPLLLGRPGRERVPDELLLRRRQRLLGQLNVGLLVRRL